MKPLRRPLQLYLLIVALYAALVGWWVYFFSHEGALLAGHLAESGAPLDEAQRRALEEVTGTTARMFLAETAFLGLLMLASVWFVLRALHRESELARQQRDFLSAVTHELRSPLASARLYLESLALGRATGEKAARYVRHAHEDLTRLSSLVEDLLEGRRIAERGVEVRPVPLDLGALAAARVERLAAAHEGQPGTVVCEVEGAVRALADEEAVTRILDNLVSNALKYGGETPAVQVRVAVDGGRAVLTVRDHGPGLRGADPEQIFGAFVRGGDESRRTRPGAGLGLYLVRELARARGGAARARDGLPGGGTELRVELPLAPKAGAGA